MKARNSRAALGMAAAIALAAVSAAVSAQDAFDWSGFYAGAFGGYATGTLDWTMYDLDGTPYYTSAPLLEGITGGALLG